MLEPFRHGFSNSQCLLRTNKCHVAVSNALEFGRLAPINEPQSGRYCGSVHDDGEER